MRVLTPGLLAVLTLLSLGGGVVLAETPQVPPATATNSSSQLTVTFRSKSAFHESQPSAMVDCKVGTFSFSNWTPSVVAALNDLGASNRDIEKRNKRLVKTRPFNVTRGTLQAAATVRMRNGSALKSTEVDINPEFRIWHANSLQPAARDEARAILRRFVDRVIFHLSKGYECDDNRSG